MLRCLEIGPGDKRLPGDWTTVDVVPREGIVDYVCQWGSQPLPFADESFDVVYAAHVLEHIPWHQTINALREAVRVLMPGGRIEIHVPDFDVLARAARGRACLDEAAEAGLNQRLHWMHWVAERLFHLGPPEQWHRACFNEEHLRWCLAEAGLVDTQRIWHERGAGHGVINLGMSAAKPDPASVNKQGNGSMKSHVDRSPMSDRRVDARVSEPPPEVVPGAEGLPPCHSRREFDAASHTFFCAHPKVHMPGQLASPEICLTCTRWQEPPPDEFRLYTTHAGVKRLGPCWHLGSQVGKRLCKTCPGEVHVKVFECEHCAHDFTTVIDCSRCPDYEQRLAKGTVSKWAVGVTTAPRREPTLARTLEGLQLAGWNEVRLFAEPGCPLPTDIPGLVVSVTERQSTLGAWPNWYLGLSELYQRDPHADAYLLAQDDVVFCRNVRPYLERTLWPAERLAVVSIYNPLSGDTFRAIGGYGVLPAGGLPGALALVFPNLAVRLLLGDPQVLLHRRRGASHSLKLIDVVVGTWAQLAALPAMAVFPSLCQHVGDTSTLWPASEDRFQRLAVSFPGESFDALALMERAPPELEQERPPEKSWAAVPRMEESCLTS